MSWKGVTVMDQRVRFISEYLNAYFPFIELCKQFEISRKTGYKWVNRYEEYGAEGLADKSRKPHHCPHQTDEEIVQDIIRARSKHPTWGPKKLLEIVSGRHPDWDLPAISTTADLLNRKGLIPPGKRRLRRKHPVCQSSERKMPKKIRAYDYPLQFELRRVSRNGGIRWKHLWVNVSQTLMENYIGFEEIEEGVHNVYFYDILIGRFFEEINRIKDIIDRVPTRPIIVKQSYPCT